MDWVFKTYDDEMQHWRVYGLWAVGTHIMGRNLYEEMANYWPTSNEPFAPPMNEIPNVVFSKTLSVATWRDTRIANGDLAVEITQVRSEPGKPMLLQGGPTRTHAFAELDLIDEYILIIHPIVLVGGLPLFAKPIDLKILASMTFPAGALALTYGHTEERRDQLKVYGEANEVRFSCLQRRSAAPIAATK